MLEMDTFNLSNARPNLPGRPGNLSFLCELRSELLVYKFSTHFFLFPLAEEDYDQFCLAYMFTYRDFEMGTLGLAWTGDLKNAGGVCEKNGVSCARSEKKSNLMSLSYNVLNESTFHSDLSMSMKGREKKGEKENLC